MTIQLCKIKNLKISAIYYILVLILSMLNCIYLPLKVGIISDFLMIFMVWKEGLFKNLRVKPFLLFYTVWCILSYVWMGGNRVSGMIMSFGYTILPICFFIVGKKIDYEERKYYFRLLINVTRIMLIISLLLVILMPDFYCEYLINKSWVSDKDRFIAKIEARMRMQGFFGATPTGFFCAFLFLADFKQLLWREFNKKTIFFFYLDILFLMMNSRKSAILVAFLLMICEFWNYFKVKRRTASRGAILIVISVFLIGLLVLVALHYGFDFKFVFDLIDRFSAAGMDKALGNRANDNANAISHMTDYMFVVGNGFGSSGHRADVDSGIFIFDNNIMLIFVETGIIGLFLFFCAIFENSNKVILNKRYFSLEFYIVFLSVVQSAASNIMENQFITPLFFLSLGCCSNWQDCKNRGELYD